MKKARIVTAVLALCALALPALSSGQGQAQGPPQVVPADRVGKAPRVEELMKRHPSPRAYGFRKEVPILTPGQLEARKNVDRGRDPLVQAPGAVTRQTPAATLSFEGYSNDDNVALFGGTIAPPDTEGDVGTTYYVQYNNLGWMYFNKSDGSVAGGPYPGNIFWQGFGGVCESDNAGDPIVLYDQFADRWVFSQFTSPANPDGHQCFAVTEGSDPAGPYNLYDFVVSPGQFNDYEKITVWTDGAGQSAYHMTSNEFAGGFVGVNATAFDRNAMLAGDPASFIQYSLPTTTGTRYNFSLQPSHLEGSALPPAGTCNKYIMAFDNETWGLAAGSDGYRFWTFCVDFDTPANASFVEGSPVATAEFDANLCGFGPCIQQPGTLQRLDTLSQFTMYRFANRYFPGQGLRGVISHSVDSDGSDLAGVRWALIDVDNHAVLDSGTWAPGDGVSRWMPSISMDKVGNIGIGFTKSSSAVFPSVYFVGRESGDAPGTLQGEVACIDGTGSQLGVERWGDYAAVSVDPVDECTFWITNEYVETTGSWNWTTRICSFSFASCTGGGAVCGNDTIEGAEVCDGTDLGGATCSSEGCTGGGALACLPDCSGFDTTLCLDCPVCNDNGICELGEDCTTCPNDCASGTSSGAVCGNGLCEAGDGENGENCSADCNGKLNGKPSNRFSCGFGDSYAPNGCGDSRCTSDGYQCTEIPVPSGSFCCGNLTCESGESCATCALDCSTGAEVCNDGIDNDCNGFVDCDDTACTAAPSCQQVDCSEFTSKKPCNAQDTCRWNNRTRTCIPN